MCVFFLLSAFSLLSLLRLSLSPSAFHFFPLPPARFNFENGTPSTNFDTFPAAIMTVFQVRREGGEGEDDAEGWRDGGGEEVREAKWWKKMRAGLRL